MQERAPSRSRSQSSHSALAQVIVGLLGVLAYGMVEHGVCELEDGGVRGILAQFGARCVASRWETHWLVATD